MLDSAQDGDMLSKLDTAVNTGLVYNLFRFVR